MSVLEAVERDLKRVPADLAESALAETAKSLARELDADNSATSKSMCARALAEVLEQLRELTPPKEEGDRTDDLRARREKRRARSTAASHSASS